MNLSSKPRKHDNVNRISTGNWNKKIWGIRVGCFGWNIRMLYKPRKLKNINIEKTKYKLHIVSLQETCWIRDGNIQVENLTILYSGVKSNEYEKGVGK